MANNVTDATFESEVLQADEPVLVDFWAEWCGPCHAVAPVLERIADEHNLKLVKVNIDENQDLAMRYGIQSIPNMMLFEGGAPKASAVGAMPKGMLERQLGFESLEGEELLRRLGRFAALDEPEEVRMLGEVFLELSETRAGPVLEPGLGDVVLDAVKAAFTHLCA
jgi:thioredoxin 1